MTSISNIIFEKTIEPDRIFAYSRDSNNDWQPKTIGMLIQDVTMLVGAFSHAGLKQGDCVCTFIPGDYELATIELALLMLGITLVPSAPDLPEETALSILAMTKAKGIIVESANDKRLNRSIFFSLCLSDLALFKDNHGSISSTLEIASSIKDSDIALICYTSGTTGTRKGVMLSHGALRAQVKNFLAAAHDVFNSTASFVLFTFPGGLWFHLSLLESIVSGTTIYFSNAKRYRQDLREVSSTFFLGSHGYVKEIYEAIRSGSTKISSVLGEACKTIISGSSSTLLAIEEFFRDQKIQYLNCYGASECMVATLTPLNQKNPLGSIGKPIPGVEIKIGGDGELLIKTDSLFSGYLNNPEKTTEALTDGWYKTSDIVEQDSNGYLYLKGRKDDYLVTLQGPLVWSTDLEEKIYRCDLVKQSIIIGHNKPYIIALITLDPKTTKNKTDQEIDFEIRQHIEHINENLTSYSQIKKYLILKKQFTVENGELNALKKINRNIIKMHYEKEINELYS